MTLLQIIRQVLAELGLQDTNSVVGNNNTTVRQCLAALTRLGMDLAREYDWQALRREHIVYTKASTVNAALQAGNPVIAMDSTSGITTDHVIAGTGVVPYVRVKQINSAQKLTVEVAPTLNGTYGLSVWQNRYPLPPDWKKQIPQTEWNRTASTSMPGPLNPQTFAAGKVWTGPLTHDAFTIANNALQLLYQPANAQMITFAYQSKNWAVGAGSAYKDQPTDDADEILYDASLMILGTKLLFLQAKGLDFSLDAAQYSSLLARCKAQDASAQQLSITPAHMPPQPTVPDGNWTVQ